MERNRQSISIGTDNRFHPLVRHPGFLRVYTLLVETIESSADLALQNWLALNGKYARRALATNLLEHQPFLALSARRFQARWLEKHFA